MTEKLGDIHETDFWRFAEKLEYLALEWNGVRKICLKRFSSLFLTSVTVFSKLTKRYSVLYGLYFRRQEQTRTRRHRTDY